MDAIAASVRLDRGDVGVHPQIDAAIAHGLGQPVAQLHVEVAQDLVAAIEHGHRDAEPIEDRGEFHADIAGADDGDAGRQLLQLETLVGADQMLLAGNVGHHRMAAGSHQDGLGRQRLVAVGELDLVRTHQRGAGEKLVDPGRVQDAGIDPVQPVDLAPDIMDQRRPVEA